MSHSGTQFSIVQEEKSSRSLEEKSFSSSSSSSAPVSTLWNASPDKATPSFFHALPVEIIQKNILFDFLDLRSKAKLTRTCSLFSSQPEYPTALRDFNMFAKIFFEFVLDGKKDEVLLMLTQCPELHFATAEFIDDSTGEKFKRTAFQLALAAEDVGREGCDLCLCNNLGEATSLEKLALYSDGNNLTPFRYIAKGREWTIENGTGPGQLNPAHFATLKVMYNNPSLLQQNLNLSHEALTQVQEQAYSALLKITSAREHTLFVKEEGMAQGIEYSLRAQPGSELEIARAINEQFDEGWEEREEERAVRELAALKEVAKAISESLTNQACEAALQAFRNLVKPRITKTGKHFNGKLLADACEVWENEFWNAAHYDSSKSSKGNLFCNEVLGYIKSIGPANYRQIIAQGLQPTLELGEKLKRSFKSRAGGVSLDARGRLGGFWIDLFGRAVWGPSYDLAGRPRCGGFSKLCSSKNSVVAKYYATARIARSEAFEAPLYNPVTFRK